MICKNRGFVKQIDEPVKSHCCVIPANAGIQNLLKFLDTGFHRYDKIVGFPTFYETIKVGFYCCSLFL